MNNEINNTDKSLLEIASKAYSVPLEVLESVYRMGRNEGYLKGLDWRSK